MAVRSCDSKRVSLQEWSEVLLFFMRVCVCMLGGKQIEGMRGGNVCVCVCVG